MGFNICWWSLLTTSEYASSGNSGKYTISCLSFFVFTDCSGPWQQRRKRHCEGGSDGCEQRAREQGALRSPWLINLHQSCCLCIVSKEGVETRDSQCRSEESAEAMAVPVVVSQDFCSDIEDLVSTLVNADEPALSLLSPSRIDSRRPKKSPLSMKRSGDGLAKLSVTG